MTAQSRADPCSASEHGIMLMVRVTPEAPRSRSGGVAVVPDGGRARAPGGATPPVGGVADAAPLAVSNKQLVAGGREFAIVSDGGLLPGGHLKRR